MTVQLKEGVEYVCANGFGPVTWNPEPTWGQGAFSDGMPRFSNGKVRGMGDRALDLVGLWEPQWIDGPAPDDIPAGKVAEVQHRLVDAAPMRIKIFFSEEIETGPDIWNGHSDATEAHNAIVTIYFLPDGTPDWASATIEAAP